MPQRLETRHSTPVQTSLAAVCSQARLVFNKNLHFRSWEEMLDTVQTCRKDGATVEETVAWSRARLSQAERELGAWHPGVVIASIAGQLQSVSLQLWLLSMVEIAIMLTSKRFRRDVCLHEAQPRCLQWWLTAALADHESFPRRAARSEISQAKPVSE